MFGKIKEQQIYNSVAKLPVLSEIVSRGLELLNDENCSIREVTELLGKDQSIAAKIIKLANSAFYGYPRQISSLSEAIVIVGFNSLKTLLVTASASNLLQRKVEGYMISEGQLWKHSYAVAYTASITAKMTGKYDSDKAFTAGILHDIGKLILGNYLKGSYKRVVTHCKHNHVDFTDAEQKFLGYHHAEVGGMILEHWNFPLTMANAVRHHHKPVNGKPVEENTEAIDRNLMAIIYLANTWVKEEGIGISVENYGESKKDYFETELGITEEKKLSIISFLDEEMGRMHELFPSDNQVELTILK